MTQPKIEGVGHGIPRMLYASDGSNWYAILVDSDGHVKIDVVTYPGINAYNNIPFGFNANWDENLGGTATGTTYTKAATAVPAGAIWVLQGISIQNSSRAATMVYLQIFRASGGIITLNFAATLGQWVPLLAVGTFTLAVGDYAQVYMASTQNGDSISAGLVGYKMKIA